MDNQLSHKEQAEKTALRLQAKTRLQDLKLERKLAAAFSLNYLLPYLLQKRPVLSFYSFLDEIDTSTLNADLAQNNLLLLPQIEGDEIIPLAVHNTQTDLIEGPWGLFQPDPDRCLPCDITQIGCILVPALAFDRSYHRLGRGKGFYDRFLKRCPEIPAFGLGFTDQLTFTPLPVEPHDVKLSGLFLF